MIRAVTASRPHPDPTPELPPRGPSGKPAVDASFAWCEAFTRAHHENFPVASRFLPKRLRKHVWALYSFARTADDFADEPAYEGRRSVELDRFADQLEQAWHGEAEHPIFVALAESARELHLPITPLKDLISAFQMDLRVRRYATFNDLTAYTSLAAKPIGRVLLWVWGCRDAEPHRFAEDLSTALALTNFWQDLAADVERDRIYLPIEDLRHFGVPEADLLARKQTARLGALLRYECARTRAIFERARPLIDLVDDSLGVEVAMIWHGGYRALAKVEARADSIFGPRVALSALDKARVLTEALRLRGAGLLSREREK
jgi:squalene synthase HpnC